MIDQAIFAILEKRKTDGWVPESDAKRIFQLAHVPVPRFAVAASREEALQKGSEIGFPLAAKVVSIDIVHKSDVGGVQINIQTPDELAAVWDRFQAMDGFEGMVIDEMVPGLELFLGARDDDQFGPVVLLGIGGTSVEIYQDVAIRMAPLQEEDVSSMIRELKGSRLITGYRGKPAVNIEHLSETVIRFADLAMALEGKFSSMEANPLMATPDQCVAADARIILPSFQHAGEKNGPGAASPTVNNQPIAP